MKLQNNQSGIAHALVVLLIAVILGAAGYAGWRVYEDSKPRQDNPEPQSQTSNNEAAQTNIPDDFVEYKSEDIGLSFAYPRQWNIREGGTQADTPGIRLLSNIRLTSNDFKESTSTYGSQFTRQGAIFYIDAIETDKTLEEIEPGSSAARARDIKRLKIAGTDARDYFQEGYDGPPHQVLQFVHRSQLVSIRYRYQYDAEAQKPSDSNEEYLRIRQQIINSIKLF